MGIIRTMGLALVSLTMLSACSTMMGDDTPPASDTEQHQMKATEKTQRLLYLDVVEGLKSQGKYRAVLAYLDDYDRRYYDDDRSAILRAEALVGLGEGEKAVLILKRLSSGPMKGRAYAAMGKVWVGRGQWNKAAKTFEVALKTDPTNANWLNNLGYAHLKLGQNEKGLELLQQALELDESNVSVRNNVILAYFLAGDLQTARRIIEKLPKDEQKGVKALLQSFRTEK